MDDNEGLGTTLKHLREMIDKGEWKAALTAIDRLQQSTPRKIETRAIMANCHLLRARALLHLGDLTKAWADSNRAITLAKDAQQPAIEAEAHCVISNIHWKKGKLDDALRILETASEAAKRSGDDRVLGIVHLERATVRMKAQAFGEAEHEFREAVLALERVGEQRQLARAYNNFAHVFMYQGQWKKAEEMFQKCRRLAERAGFRSIAGWAAFNRAEVLIELGQVDEAKKDLEWTIPILEELGDNYGLIVSYALMSTVHAIEKDFDVAEDFLRKATHLDLKLDVPHMKGRLAYSSGMISKYRGEKAAARRSFNEAKEVFAKLGSSSEVARMEGLLKGL